MTTGAALGAPAAAYEVGRRYEATLSVAARRDGAHYTPPDVAEGLVARALELATGTPRSCWDPASGGGVFLVALAEALHRRGVPTDVVVQSCVRGTDLDPGAAEASRQALATWAAERGGTGATPRVEVADGLDIEVQDVDVVVGNPPFRNQLGAETARDAATSASRRERFGAAAAGYVDDAVLFLVASAWALRPGGVACLIQPRSSLAASHAAAARAEVVADGRRLGAAWFPGERVFGAEVDVWAPFVVHDGCAEVPVRRFTGRRAAVEAEPVGAVTEGEWGSLVAAGDGVPEVDCWSIAGTLGDVATATAGFRDEYYALVAAAVADEPPGGRGLRAVTSGLVDPGRCDWGVRPTTLGKARWDHPWIDRDALAAWQPRVARWVERLAVPKVLVATQTKVVEAVADHVGDLVPVTPVIAVLPDPGAPTLDELVVALCSPPVSAWAQRRRGGTGMSPSTIRLAASDLAAVPLPGDGARWRDAARSMSAGAPWPEVGTAMCAAYGLEDTELVDWWAPRLPRRLRSTTGGGGTDVD